MNERPFHLGVDYGTSTSKLVLRDYGSLGGAKSFVVGTSEQFRIPSGLRCLDGYVFLSELLQDHAPGERYESLKMRVAEEALGMSEGFHYGPRPNFPTGFSATDFAILTVWWLLSIGYRAACELTYASGGGDIIMGATVGIPMSFYDNERICDRFLSIAKTAWRLYSKIGPLQTECSIELTRLKMLLDSHRDMSVPRDRTNLKEWIRSETEAAMWWAFSSPTIADGPFAQVDIGAGTTNVSMFRIYSEGGVRKHGLAFFASCSEPAGMDAIDDQIASRIEGNIKSFSLRGREEQLIGSQRMKVDIQNFVKDKLWEAYRKAWITTSRNINGWAAETSAWRLHRVILVGGGSLIPTINSCIATHPGTRNSLAIQQLAIPQDLYFLPERPAPQSLVQGLAKLVGLGRTRPLINPATTATLPFLATAYGLANRSLAIPPAIPPNELPPMPSVKASRSRPTAEDLYPK
jgi:hypothetical protein